MRPGFGIAQNQIEEIGNGKERSEMHEQRGPWLEVCLISKESLLI
jgi:hypothetical protein